VQRSPSRCTLDLAQKGSAVGTVTKTKIFQLARTKTKCPFRACDKFVSAYGHGTTLPTSWKTAGHFQLASRTRPSSSLALTSVREFSLYRVSCLRSKKRRIIPSETDTSMAASLMLMNFRESTSFIGRVGFCVAIGFAIFSSKNSLAL
jgi:hypothetical protein